MLRTVAELIRFHRLVGDATPIPWRYVADRLAEELAALVRRFDGDPHLTEADHDRLARAEVALHEHQLAAEEAAGDDDVDDERPAARAAGGTDAMNPTR
jgi:hypothetical protein